MVIVIALTVVQFRYVEKEGELLMPPARAGRHGREPPAATVLSHLVLVLGVLIVAFPVYMTFIASTHTAQEIVQNVPMSLLPGDNIVQSYRLALFGGQTDNGSRIPPVAPMLWSA